jgi:2-amino-4-hydroxy-6-hydroxymethyldihydropteridine diphosphokinase
VGVSVPNPTIRKKKHNPTSTKATNVPKHEEKNTLKKFIIRTLGAKIVTKMETAYLLLGSNIGDRKANFFHAIQHLSACGTIVAQSSLYETKPWGKTDQADFLNQVVALATEATPQELLNQVLSIERGLGRKRVDHWGPRVIDIDILLMGQTMMQTPTLTLPHPQLINRMFALAPLAELAGNQIHPSTGLTIRQHLIDCQDKLAVTLME